MWDERYSEEGFAYGAEANDFLRVCREYLRGGNALCLAEGQGRNAAWLAQLGYKVTAVDLSSVGLACAVNLAHERGVRIETVQADLADFDFGINRWDVIVSIWAHTEPLLRSRIHRQIIASLAPGGLFVLEAYHPANIGRGTGGPQDPDLCLTMEELENDFGALNVLHLAEVEREITEGKYHAGMSAVTQMLAEKPQL